LLEVQDLCVSAVGRSGATKLLEQLSFVVESGESVGLLGASGSGKSMTALAVLGLLPNGVEQTSGELRFAGQSLAQLSGREWQSLRGAGIALVFQDPASALNPVLRVGEQVVEVLEAHGLARGSAARQRVVQLFAEVQLEQPERMAHRYPHQLSGGQRQRVMLAIALAAEPDLLIADEPTTALDVTVQAAILQLVAEIRERRGLAMLWISHDLGVVARCCQRVLVLDQGQVVESAACEDFLRAPSSQAGHALVQASRELGTRQLASAAPSEELLEVRGLTVRYAESRDFFGRVQAWQDAVQPLDFSLAAGRTLAVVGESGSGKSSLARALLGLVPAGGEAELVVDGRRHALIGASGAAQRLARAQMGMVFQDPSGSLNPRLRVWRSVAEPLAVHAAAPRSEWRKCTVELLERVGLTAEHAERFPGELSGGQKQRVAIARAIALRPSLVICDEAVSALDLAVQARVLDLLDELQAADGLAYLFITHDLAVVENFADEVLVMRNGEVLERGAVQSVFADPQHDYTRRLIEASPHRSLTSAMLPE